MCDRSQLALEANARRIAKRSGYAAHKSRCPEGIDNFGGFALVNHDNCIVAGSRFDLTAQDVIEFCDSAGARGRA